MLSLQSLWWGLAGWPWNNSNTSQSILLPCHFYFGKSENQFEIKQKDCLESFLLLPHKSFGSSLPNFGLEFVFYFSLFCFVFVFYFIYWFCGCCFVLICCALFCFALIWFAYIFCTNSVTKWNGNNYFLFLFINTKKMKIIYIYI